MIFVALKKTKKRGKKSKYSSVLFMQKIITLPECRANLSSFIIPALLHLIRLRSLFKLRFADNHGTWGGGEGGWECIKGERGGTDGDGEE